MIKNLKLLFYLFLFVIVLLLLFISVWQSLILSIVLIGSYLIFEYRDSRVLQVVLVFLLIYPLFTLDYFLYDIKFAAYRHFFSDEYIIDFLELTILFFLGILLSSFSFNNGLKVESKLSVGSNFSWILLFIFSTFILIFGVSGDSIISRGTYSREHLSTLGGLKIYEYFLIFYFPLLLSARTKILNIITIILGGLFCIKGLLIGGRIETLQYLLLIGVFYRKRFDKIKTVKFLLLSFFSFFMFSIYSSVRNNPLLLFSDQWTELFTLSNTTVRESVKVSHHGDVAYASMRMIGLVEIGIWDLSYRIKSLFLFFLRIIVPIKFINSGAADPSTDLRDIYPAGGGGTIFTYFYIWFGLLGSLLSGLLVGSIFNKFKNGVKNEYLQIYISFVIITMPRWIAYTPIVIFKFALYAVFIYYIFIKLLPKLLK
jgi:hypothetical protein